VSPCPSLKVSSLNFTEFHIGKLKHTRIDELRICGTDDVDLEDLATALCNVDHPPNVIDFWFYGESEGFSSVYDLHHLAGHRLQLKLEHIPKCEVDMLARLVETHGTITNDIVSCELQIKQPNKGHAKRLQAAGLKFHHTIPKNGKQLAFG